MRSPDRVRFAATLAIALLAIAAHDARANGVTLRSWRYPGESAPQGAAGPGVMGPGGATRVRAILNQTGAAPQFGSIGTMSGAGLTCTVVHQAPACTTGQTITIQNAQPANPDTVTVTWNTGCVLPGDCVTLRFSSLKGPIEIPRSYWGSVSQDSIAPTIVCTEAPGASPLGLGTLAALIALTGALVMARVRRPAAG
jgi:hypothetical protein